MDVLKIAKKVGNGLLSAFVPGYSQVLSVVNEFLPGDKKLGAGATGADVEKAIKSLPPDKQAELLSKKLDVEITEIQEHTNVLATLAEADKAGASTRPKIAMILTYFVVFVGVILILMLAGAVVWKQTETLNLLYKYWPLTLSLTGPPVGLLERYFGKRTREKEARYAGAFGVPMKGGVLSSIMSAIKQ